jgi:2'-hydroxyisoflavone reductase
MLRRDLLQAIGATALAACAPTSTQLLAPPRQAASNDKRAEPPPKPRPKKILILGGTGFVGPALVRDAIARGHTITLFNRGKTAPGLFPDVETILGDRQTELDRLKGRDWDAVVDTWAPGPTLVTRAAELLRDHVAHYVYVSTISVYKLTKAPLDESSTILELPPGTDLKSIKKIDETNYGALKALGEKAAETTMPGRVTNVRSGLIAGPGDKTDRFTYWPIRMARGGEMIAPGSPSDPMQFIDVRDLGAWIVGTIEGAHFGVYNVVGPEKPTIGGVLDSVAHAVGHDAKLTWVPHEWLEKNKANGWENFPAAVGPDDDEAGFAKVSAARALATGLRFRPPGVTAKDALAWWNAQPEEHRAKSPGIAPAREAELLEAWRRAKA